jgi:NAD(P)-dependent dehydrogenase (short-subunit alcohol dehydrogenase family)
VILTNKRAVILGGTSGIGLATARQLVAAGAEVIAAGRSSERIESAMAATGDAVTYRTVDVLDRAALATFFADHGPFDILVNSAVPGGRAQGPFPEMDLDAFQATFNKLWGYANSVRLGLEHLAADGCIVLVSGFPARKCKPGASAISTVGNAVEGFVRAIAPEIAPRRINAVSPGLIDTPLVPQEGEARDTFFARAVADHVIPRPGSPDEVAEAILFLIRNDFTTGTVVDVDGGALLP